MLFSASAATRQNTTKRNVTFERIGKTLLSVQYLIILRFGGFRPAAFVFPSMRSARSSNHLNRSWTFSIFTETRATITITKRRPLLPTRDGNSDRRVLRTFRVFRFQSGPFAYSILQSDHSNVVVVVVRPVVHPADTVDVAVARERLRETVAAVWRRKRSRPVDRPADYRVYEVHRPAHRTDPRDDRHLERRLFERSIIRQLKNNNLRLLRLRKIRLSRSASK